MADPEGEIGEMHDPETHAIPLAIAAALRRESAFPIYGTDYPTADGSAVRDYVHVADLAEARIAALDYLLADGATTALNLGTGIGTSVLQIIAAVERASGRRLPIVRRPRRPGDPPVLLADPGRARAVLGWQPTYTEIDDIVRTAWDWHCGQGKATVRAAV
jgi:UDP-arabinose 4-epimerase